MAAFDFKTIRMPGWPWGYTLGMSKGIGVDPTCWIGHCNRTVIPYAPHHLCDFHAEPTNMLYVPPRQDLTGATGDAAPR